MLTIVLAVAHRTRKSTQSYEEFYEAFTGRIGAMTRSYQLVSRENWIEVSLHEIVKQELEPFGLDRVRVVGEVVKLDPKRGLSMGMIMHELATNAAKYGALASEDGYIDLNWTHSPDGEVHIRWCERDGPLVVGAKQGFGLLLIEQETKLNLRGSAAFAFAPAGLAVDLRFDVGRAAP